VSHTYIYIYIYIFPAVSHIFTAQKLPAPSGIEYFSSGYMKTHISELNMTSFYKPVTVQVYAMLSDL